MSTSILKSKRHQTIGRKKHGEGQIFEAQFDQACRRKQLFYIAIPLCAKIAGKRVIPLKSPFDRILASNLGSAFVDLKSLGTGKRISRSQMNIDQIMNLNELYKRNLNAGYVVNFREINAVYFFNASKLIESYRSSVSLTLDQGVCLGEVENINPLLIFSKPVR